MDDKQAAAVLRHIGSDRLIQSDRDACQRGADALEMLEWLFEENGDIPRFVFLRQAWLVYGKGLPFRAYCEARFEESKKGLTK